MYYPLSYVNKNESVGKNLENMEIFSTWKETYLWSGNSTTFKK